MPHPIDCLRRDLHALAREQRLLHRTSHSKALLGDSFRGAAQEARSARAAQLRRANRRSLS
jgi:hypothetical protein